MPYVGRPGVSPVLAVLLAQERVRPRDRILDVGCGTGTEALLLAKWGFRRVEGVDEDARSVATARGRATRARLGSAVRFHHLAAERLTERFRPASFDVVLHTLVANNLRDDRERHFREVAAVLKRSGLLVVQERVPRKFENTRPGRFPAMDELRRHFDLTRGVATHLPEHRAGRGPGYARVFLWVGRPRGRKPDP